METLKFKANIKCAGCVAKVTPLLDEYVGENVWVVDVNTPDKALTVHNEGISAETIVSAVKAGGFNAERI